MYIHWRLSWFGSLVKIEYQEQQHAAAGSDTRYREHFFEPQHPGLFNNHVLILYLRPWIILLTWTFWFTLLTRTLLVPFCSKLFSGIQLRASPSTKQALIQDSESLWKGERRWIAIHNTLQFIKYMTKVKEGQSVTSNCLNCVNSCHQAPKHSNMFFCIQHLYLVQKLEMHTPFFRVGPAKDATLVHLLLQLLWLVLHDQRVVDLFSPHAHHVLFKQREEAGSGRTQSSDL